MYKDFFEKVSKFHVCSIYEDCDGRIVIVRKRIKSGKYARIIPLQIVLASHEERVVLESSL